MKSSDSLHSLIHSLTKTERRYFTLYAARHVIGEKNNYLRLFEAIDRQVVYDQEALKKLPFVKSLSSEKNYLYALILKSMRAYGASAKPEQDIWAALQNADFLQQKGLHAEAQKQLAHAKATSLHFQKIEYLPHILEEEATIVKREGNRSLDQAIEQIVIEAAAAKDLLVTQLKHASIYHRVFTTARQAKTFKTPDFLQELEYLLSDELAEAPPSRATLQTMLHYHQAMYTIHQARKEAKEAHPHFEEVVRLIEAHPHLFPQHEHKYRVGLSNLLVSAATLGRWQLFPTVISKIRGSSPLSIDVEAEVFQNLAYLEMVYCLNRGDFEAAEQLVPEIASGLEKYASLLPAARVLAIIYNVGLLYFIIGSINLARKWFTKIQDFPKTEHRQDIQIAAQLMLLLLLLHREDIELLDYRLRSMRRSADSQSGLGEFESLVLDFYAKCVKAGAGDGLKSICKSFLRKLESLPSQPVVAYWCIQELIYWAKSKVSGKSIKAIVEEGLRHVENGDSQIEQDNDQ